MNERSFGLQFRRSGVHSFGRCKRAIREARPKAVGNREFNEAIEKPARKELCPAHRNRGPRHADCRPCARCEVNRAGNASISRGREDRGCGRNPVSRDRQARDRQQAFNVFSRKQRSAAFSPGAPV